MEKKKGKIEKQILDETKAKRDAIEQDKKDASALIAELKEKQSLADGKKKEYESAKEQMEKARVEFEGKSAKCDQLLKELKEKKAKADALFSSI